MEFRPASDSSLLISFGESISPDFHREVVRLLQALDTKPPGVRNVHPAFASVLVDFDPRRYGHQQVEQLVRDRLTDWRNVPAEPVRTVEIPVCYGGESGPDLEDVARHCGLPSADVIRLHSAADYLVYFLGFSPGFPYLGDLPLELATPRLPTPRQSVPAGSVAIGGSQTGIYPSNSPGGWRIIGRTTIRLFDATADPPALLRAGDHIRFVPQDTP